jgi:hypothetical protein
MDGCGEELFNFKSREEKPSTLVGKKKVIFASFRTAEARSNRQGNLKYAAYAFGYHTQENLVCMSVSEARQGPGISLQSCTAPEVLLITN